MSRIRGKCAYEHVLPPRIMCVSQVPVAPCWPAGSATFHSTTIAPAAGPRVEKMMSVISSTPVEPLSPTCTTGRAAAPKASEPISRHRYKRKRRTVVVVLEVAAPAEDRRPRLADDLRARRDGDGVRDEVHARVEEDDPAARVRVEHRLHRRRVVRLAVARRALRLHAHELVRGVARVLRVPAAEHAPRRVEQAARLRDRRDRRLHERARPVRAGEDVPLRPRVDRQRPAREDRRAVQDADGDGHVVEADVVQHERAVEHPVARRRSAEEDGGVRHDGIDDGFSTSATSNKVKADLYLSLEKLLKL